MRHREVRAMREGREGDGIGGTGRLDRYGPWAVEMRWGPANQLDISGHAIEQQDHTCVSTVEVRIPRANRARFGVGLWHRPEAL